MDKNSNSVSIVTVCRDDPNNLVKTCESLLTQSYKNWNQVIVLSSTEDLARTKAVEITKSDPRIMVTYQDGFGIYNAMNKGTSLINSEFVWFMNSGDVFKSNSTLESAVSLIQFMGADLIIGGYKVQNESRNFGNRTSKIGLNKFSLNRRGGCHQSMLFRLNENFPLIYDENYRIASDFKLVLQYINRGKVHQVSEIFSEIDAGGVSHKEIRLTINEKQAIRKDFFGRYSLGYLSGKFWTFAVRLKVFLNSRKSTY